MKLEEIELGTEYKEMKVPLGQQARYFVMPPTKDYDWTIIADDSTGILCVSVADAWNCNKKVPERIVEKVKKDFFKGVKTRTEIRFNHPYIFEVEE